MLAEVEHEPDDVDNFTLPPALRFAGWGVTLPRFIDALIIGGSDIPRPRVLSIDCPHCAHALDVTALVQAVTPLVALDPYLSIRALAAYSGLSVDTLQRFINLPPDQGPLPCHRYGDKIIRVRKTTFDRWFAQFETRGPQGLLSAIAQWRGQSRD